MQIVAPVLEPLSLEQGQLRAGLAWTVGEGDPRDVLMQGFIQAARAHVERETGIALLTQTHAVLIDAGGQRAFALPRRPVQSVVIEAVDPDTGVATPWSASPFGLDPGSVDPRPARITYRGFGCWPCGLRATIVAGFDTVEALQAAAPDLVHAVGLLTAHYATIGRDLASAAPVSETPLGFAALIAPYQLVTVP